MGGMSAAGVNRQANIYPLHNIQRTSTTVFGIFLHLFDILFLRISLELDLLAIIIHANAVTTAHHLRHFLGWIES